MAQKAKRPRQELEEIEEQIDEAERALSAVNTRRQNLRTELAELGLANDEAFARGVAPDFKRAREVREAIAEVDMEALHGELRLGVLQHEAALVELRVLSDEEQEIGPKIARKQEQQRKLEREIGALRHQVSVIQECSSDLRSVNVRRQAYIEDVRRRLQAVMSGEPDPGSSIRRDDKGHLRYRLHRFSEPRVVRE